MLGGYVELLTRFMRLGFLVGSISGTLNWGAKIGAPNRRKGGENLDTCVAWRSVSVYAKVLLLSRVGCRLNRPAPKGQS